MKKGDKLIRDEDTAIVLDIRPNGVIYLEIQWSTNDYTFISHYPSIEKVITEGTWRILND